MPEEAKTPRMGLRLHVHFFDETGIEGNIEDYRIMSVRLNEAQLFTFIEDLKAALESFSKMVNTPER